MSATGLDVFDSTLQKTHSWLNELMRLLDWQDKHKAYLAMRISLQALRDRLTAPEVAQLGAQLPMLVRGFYYEGWRPDGAVRTMRHKDEFLAPIAAHRWRVMKQIPATSPESHAFSKDLKHRGFSFVGSTII